MNVALILAGGVGARVGASVPKQYIEVLGKPIIVHTLEKFQQSPEIDAIEVVCAPQWRDHVEQLARQWDISKLRWIVDGGAICQESIRNGLFALEGKIDPDDLVLVHMSVSPLINQQTIHNALEVAREKGNSFADTPIVFCMARKSGEGYCDENAYKEDYVQLNMPWTMSFGDYLALYQEAYEKGIGTDLISYTPSLMFDLGKRVYTFPDNEANKQKIAYKADLDFFEGYLLVQERRRAQQQDQAE